MSEQPLDAGSELDALVAKKVMGYLIAPTDTYGPVVPPYSTDIATAWEVVEKMRGDFGMGISGQVSDRIGEPWMVIFRSGCGGYGETASLAICRAAILSVTAELSKK